jgi:hypothetical protein
MTAPTVEQEEIDPLRVKAALLKNLLFEALRNGYIDTPKHVSPRWIKEALKAVNEMMKFKVAIALLCAMTILSGAYAFRQRQWALKLRDQLVETNKDDVKLMHILSAEEKGSVCRRLREQGENRIADWITTQYLATQNEANKEVAEFK